MSIAFSKVRMILGSSFRQEKAIELSHPGHKKSAKNGDDLAWMKS